MSDLSHQLQAARSQAHSQECARREHQERAADAVAVIAELKAAAIQGLAALGEAQLRLQEVEAELDQTKRDVSEQEEACCAVQVKCGELEVNAWFRLCSERVVCIGLHNWSSERARANDTQA